MRISDWSSDVCSSDLFQLGEPAARLRDHRLRQTGQRRDLQAEAAVGGAVLDRMHEHQRLAAVLRAVLDRVQVHVGDARSEEHTSELQSLMRISYAVFCLKKNTTPAQSATRSDRKPTRTQARHEAHTPTPHPTRHKQ